MDPRRPSPGSMCQRAAASGGGGRRAAPTSSPSPLFGHCDTVRSGSHFGRRDPREKWMYYRTCKLSPLFAGGKSGVGLTRPGPLRNAGDARHTGSALKRWTQRGTPGAREIPALSRFVVPGGLRAVELHLFRRPTPWPGTLVSRVVARSTGRPNSRTSRGIVARTGLRFACGTAPNARRSCATVCSRVAIDVVRTVSGSEATWCLRLVPRSLPRRGARALCRSEAKLARPVCRVVFLWRLHRHASRLRRPGR